MQNYNIVRKQQDWGRSYVVSVNGKDYVLPSVTTILKLLTEPKYTAIKEEFGEERWSQILDNASYRGTVMHTMLEVFFIEYSKSGDADISLQTSLLEAKIILDKDPQREKQVKIGRNLFWNFYHAEFWKPVKRVVHNEVFLWTIFRGGWAGACDFIYEDWNGDHIVIDFKSSSDIKSEDEIESYFCQISAYMFMYAELYGIMPARGEIWISNEKDDGIQKFIVHSCDMKKHLKKFISLREEFQNKYILAGNN